MRHDESDRGGVIWRWTRSQHVDAAWYWDKLAIEMEKLWEVMNLGRDRADDRCKMKQGKDQKSIPEIDHCVPALPAISFINRSVKSWRA